MTPDELTDMTTSRKARAASGSHASQHFSLCLSEGLRDR